MLNQRGLQPLSLSYIELRTRNLPHALDIDRDIDYASIVIRRFLMFRRTDTQ